jgi:serine/threonine protein kinase
MPKLGNNALLLVRSLSVQPLFDDRYEHLELKNVDPVSLEKTGCFSLVYKAYDRVSQKWVALKFYDPQWVSDKYRLDCFYREHAILATLLNQNRCLQLASGMKNYILKVHLPSVGEIELPCPYFAVEWIDAQVERYFLQQETFTPAIKLRLFNEILLSVEALHTRNVFHRDIKADNMRATSTDEIRRIVVAIDLGTAARYDSAHVKAEYGAVSVGAPWYASPEARCGLAGNRDLARYTDVYALGCLLFELFNVDYFFKGLCNQNPHYDTTLSALSMYVGGVTDPAEQVRVWRKAINQFGASVAPVKIDGPGHNVPLAVVGILNELVGILTHVDYEVRKRPLSWVRTRVWSAIRILENDELARRRILLARAQRQRSVDKAREREERLEARLRERKALC